MSNAKTQLLETRHGEVCLVKGVAISDRTQVLNRFLAGIERRAFRMAQIATGNDDDALDLVQDAMLQLVQRYSDKEESEWTPLLYCILQSRIRDWYRRTRVRNKFRAWFGSGHDDEENQDPLDLIPDCNAAPPDHELAMKQAATALDAALRTLPLRQQQAFLLRAWEELDVAQTAKAMGCSEGSVKTHLFRAVRALRKNLGEHWP